MYTFGNKEPITSPITQHYYPNRNAENINFKFSPFLKSTISTNSYFDANGINRNLHSYRVWMNPEFSLYLQYEYKHRITTRLLPVGSEHAGWVLSLLTSVYNYTCSSVVTDTKTTNSNAVVSVTQMFIVSKFTIYCYLKSKCSSTFFLQCFYKYLRC